MGILRTNTLSGIGTDGPVFDGVTKFDTQGYVVPPVGITSDRTRVGVTTAQGAIRFNTDSQKLEFYAQDQWWEMVIDTPALGVAADTGAGARGITGGGQSPSGSLLTTEYINISSTGNAISFGNLTGTNRVYISACASSTRGVWGAGSDFPGNTRENTIDYVTISSTGNAIDFGDFINSYLGGHFASCSSSTRGIWGGGFDLPASANYNIIQYITIASTGNAVDYGDLTVARRGIGACSSPTRGLFGGGVDPAITNVIDFITISTTGNATDFGDLVTSTRRDGNGACSNSTRGLWAGGTAPTNAIDFVIISTLGNASDFGDLTVARQWTSGCASPTRGVWIGGSPITNTIDYVTILTQGNAVDFGDTVTPRYTSGACSNAHGGL